MITPLPDSDFEDAPFESQQEAEISSHDLHIDVLGTNFYITADKDPDYLNEVLAQYRFAIANTQGISGMKDDPLKVAILTGFLLCDEINKQKIQNEEEREEAVKTLDRAVQNIITRIDQFME